MELPLNQRSSRLQLVLAQIAAFVQVGEHPFADWHRPLNEPIVDLLVVEVEVENIEVVTTVDCSHHWHSFDEMVCKFMSVSLHHSVDGPHWDLRQKLAYFIGLVAFAHLVCFLHPDAKSAIRVTVVTCVTQYQDSVSTILSQLFAPLDYQIRIVYELVGWEQTVLKCAGGKRGLFSG